MAEKEEKIENAVINEIGLYYCGHLGSMSIQLELGIGQRPTNAIIDLPVKPFIVVRLIDICNGVFEDGDFIRELKGSRIRARTVCGRVVELIDFFEGGETLPTDWTECIKLCERKAKKGGK